MLLRDAFEAHLKNTVNYSQDPRLKKRIQEGFLESLASLRGSDRITIAIYTVRLIEKYHRELVPQYKVQFFDVKAVQSQEFSSKSFRVRSFLREMIYGIKTFFLKSLDCAIALSNRKNI